MSKYGYREMNTHIIAPGDEHATVTLRWAQLLVLSRMTRDVARQYKKQGFDIFADEALDYSRQLRSLAERVEPSDLHDDEED